MKGERKRPGRRASFLCSSKPARGPCHRREPAAAAAAPQTRSYSKPRSSPLNVPGAVRAVGTAFEAGPVAQAVLTAGALVERRFARVNVYGEYIARCVGLPTPIPLSICPQSGFTFVLGSETLGISRLQWHSADRTQTHLALPALVVQYTTFGNFASPDRSRLHSPSTRLHMGSPLGPAPLIPRLTPAYSPLYTRLYLAPPLASSPPSFGVSNPCYAMCQTNEYFPRYTSRAHTAKLLPATWRAGPSDHRAMRRQRHEHLGGRNSRLLAKSSRRRTSNRQTRASSSRSPRRRAHRPSSQRRIPPAARARFCGGWNWSCCGRRRGWCHRCRRWLW
jgi:hypothetical protein